MHLFFRRLGHSPYIEMTAEDRTASADFPRTYLAATQIFKGIDGFLKAVDEAELSEQGSVDLHIFAQSSYHSSEASSGEVCLNADEVARLGFPEMQRKTRTFLVSVVPEKSAGDQICVSAKLQNPPPGVKAPTRERTLAKAALVEILALLERTPADLFDRRVGIYTPPKATFDAEDVNTLFTWKV